MTELYRAVVPLLLVFLAATAAGHATGGQQDDRAPPEYVPPPPSEETTYTRTHEFCPENGTWADRRPAQTVLGVDVDADPSCHPDDPRVVAAVTRGTDEVPRSTLMETGLHEDAVRKGADRDGDGDPDVINITLEVAELNGKPTAGGLLNVRHEIAPGIAPGFWVFAPKTMGMATEGSAAADLIRMPPPAIRVEEGDEVHVTLENTHYMPHTIHLHGTDHGFMVNGSGNDGVPQTSEEPVMPGESRTYDLEPREAGTMFYHCHVQPSTHVLMGLNGMFVVAEDRPNNTLQTFNPGNGRVRNPSAAVDEDYDRAYDLQFQGVDAELHSILNVSNDPRIISKMINRGYDTTERTPDYFLLNGRSFPFTVRESQIIVEENERTKLRVLNGGSESVAIHTHGHKPTITHRDGVESPAAAQITRDVFDIAAAQRLDLALNTTDDGLNAYGPGVWFVHDHRERGVTTDGVAPGGDITTITYERYLQPNGFPETHGVSWDPYFSADYYDREVPVWNTYGDPAFFGDVQTRQPSDRTVLAIGLIGIVVGALAGLVLV